MTRAAGAFEAGKEALLTPRLIAIPRQRAMQFCHTLIYRTEAARYLHRAVDGLRCRELYARRGHLRRFETPTLLLTPAWRHSRPYAPLYLNIARC